MGWISRILFVLFLPSLCAAECIPFDQAQKHIGESQCITGKVVRVEAGARGVHYLDFCEDTGSALSAWLCFPTKKVGDVRQLAGKIIEIRGEVKEYDGRAEIVLDKAGQLGGDAGALTPLPPLPKNFDCRAAGTFQCGEISSFAQSQHAQKEGLPDFARQYP